MRSGFFLEILHSFSVELCFILLLSMFYYSVIFTRDYQDSAMLDNEVYEFPEVLFVLCLIEKAHSLYDTYYF